MLGKIGVSGGGSVGATGGIADIGLMMGVSSGPCSYAGRSPSRARRRPTRVGGGS
jgi:hypothetical protein